MSVIKNILQQVYEEMKKEEYLKVERDDFLKSR